MKIPFSLIELFCVATQDIKPFMGMYLKNKVNKTCSNYQAAY